MEFALSGNAGQLHIDGLVQLAPVQPILELGGRQLPFQSRQLFLILAGQLALVLFIQQFAVSKNAGTQGSVIGRLHPTLAGLGRAHNGGKGINPKGQHLAQIAHHLQSLVELGAGNMMGATGYQTTIEQTVRADDRRIRLGGLGGKPFGNLLGVAVTVMGSNILDRWQDNFAISSLHGLLHII